jgi:hypothetical protein
MTRASAFALLAAGALIVAGVPARAAPGVPVRVSLEIASCAELEARQIEELVRISATVVPSTDETAVAVKVACNGETLMITARRPSSDARPLRRLVRLQEVGEASRARLVSLAVTELATALAHAAGTRSGRAGPAPASRGRASTERTSTPPPRGVAAVVPPEPAAPPAAPAADDEGSSERGAEPVPPPAPPPAATTATPQARPELTAAPKPDPRPVAVVREASPSAARPVDVVLLARGGAEYFPRAFGTTASGGLRLSLDGARRPGLTFDLQGSTAGVPVSVGSVTVTTIALVPSLHARIESDSGRWSARAGAGPKVGYSFLGGNPSAPPSEAAGFTFSAPWAGISSFVALRARPAGPIVIELAGEGGVVLSPLAGLVDGRREVTITGPWLALFAAAGVLL